MDTLEDTVVLLGTSSTAMLSYSILYLAIYEKINVCQPLNFPKVFRGLKAFSGQNDKKALELLESTMGFQCAAHWSALGIIPCTAHGFSLARAGRADH